MHGIRLSSGHRIAHAHHGSRTDIAAVGPSCLVRAERAETDRIRLVDDALTRPVVRVPEGAAR
jgi:hypothetical protein